MCDKEVYCKQTPGAFYLRDVNLLLPTLLKQYAGNIQLIYLDPPFQTGDTFYIKLNGDTIKRPAYEDTLDRQEYLCFMRRVLTGCHALLHDEGAIYLHIDFRMVAHLRLLLDEIFGEKQFCNEIIWAYRSGGRSKAHFSRKHDTILFYRKTAKGYFDIKSVGSQRGAARRNHMRRSVDANGNVSYTIRTNGKVYAYPAHSLIYPSDVWADIPHLHQRNPERIGYATQKPAALLERIILASSRPGDTVMDLFSGSGTTAAVANKFGRRFIAADCSPYALFALRHRLTHAPEGDQKITLHFQDGIRVLPFGHPTMPACLHNAQKSAPLLYCTAGRLEGAAFFPQRDIVLPQSPSSTVLPQGADALHVMDAEGQQFIWRNTP
jgi:site-specific DNA-methyltransferase (adenine-specific)/adenine-specific DNA-methyltransferase